MPLSTSLFSQTEEAYEVYGYLREGRYIFSCEHASKRIPPPLQTSFEDKEILQSHWGWDIGTKELVSDLCHTTRSAAVMARFSRLLCDANRHRHRSDLIKEHVEDHPLSFNRLVDEIEAARRIGEYHEPYHQGLDWLIRTRLENPKPFLYISVHSFTPVWSRRLRSMDIGILYNLYPDLAEALQKNLQAEGFFVAMNEPYSAKFGLMYAADRHGKGLKVQHLELEFNQSILCSPERIADVAPKVQRALDLLNLTYKWTP